MKKVTLLCAMLIVFTTSAAFADGLNLHWNSCAGDGGVKHLTFACDTNVGSRDLICSVTLDTDLLAVLSDELVIHIQTPEGANLTPWWELRSNVSMGLNACRNGAISIAVQAGAACPDVFAGSSSTSMNIAALQPFTPYGPSWARLLSVNAVPTPEPVDLVLAENPAGNATWGLARFRIDNRRTVGSPSCSGCNLGACFEFYSCNLVTAGNLNNRLVSGANQTASNYVMWQGGAGTNCPAATPTKNATWGTVKSLYR